MTKYENCKKTLLHKIISEYNSGKLKSSSGNKVKSKSQAIAIGLTMSNAKCKSLFSKEDKDKLKKKTDRYLERNKLTYSGILDVIKYINMLKGKQKTEYKYKLIKFLLYISVEQKIPKNISVQVSKLF